MPTRAALLGTLSQAEQSSRTWDLIVIGGGATGLGVAVDAASRGYSVLLLEAHDFASGTSSRSTKLIHGGIRYLAQGRIGLVRESLLERARLLRNAPHIVQPLHFRIPVTSPWQWLRYRTGTWLYDRLAGKHGLKGSRASKTMIDYVDAQFDDARLAIALVRTLYAHGGVGINYLAVNGFLHDDDGRITGVSASDALSDTQFKLHGSIVINATGVWTDPLRRMTRDVHAAQPLLTMSQGTHIVLDSVFWPHAYALLLPETSDGRVIFIIPWLGKILIGTTDTPVTSATLEPQPLAGEVDYLLAHVMKHLAQPVGRADIKSMFSGLRPLLNIAHGHSPSTAQLSREHHIDVTSDGLLSITGGKWTTYRSMAQATVDQAISMAGLPYQACRTDTLPLWGASAAMRADDQTALAALSGHGVQVHPAFDLTEAQVRFFVRHEGAQTVEDILARRHRALLLDATAALAAAEPVASILADELGCDVGWVDHQIEAFKKVAQGYRAC